MRSAKFSSLEQFVFRLMLIFRKCCQNNLALSVTASGREILDLQLVVLVIIIKESHIIHYADLWFTGCEKIGYISGTVSKNKYCKQIPFDILTIGCYALLQICTVMAILITAQASE